MTFLADEAEDQELVRELRLQLANVKQQLEQNEKNQLEFINQYRELVGLLCGYDIRLGEDGFCEAENLVPSSTQCVFFFQVYLKIISFIVLLFFQLFIFSAITPTRVQL